MLVVPAESEWQVPPCSMQERPAQPNSSFEWQPAGKLQARSAAVLGIGVGIELDSRRPPAAAVEMRRKGSLCRAAVLQADGLLRQAIAQRFVTIPDSQRSKYR